MIKHQIKEGLTITDTKKTTTNDAHSSSNTGTLDYLVSTPSIMIMVIDTATHMLDKLLPSDYITVGKKIELLHEHPSIIGETISVKLTVEKITGHSVFLDVQVEDLKGIVCSGKHERAIINKEKLLEIAYMRDPDFI